MITNINEYRDFYNISKITTLDVEIELEIDVEHTQHSLERQGRDTNYVKNADIKETVNKATEQIIDNIIKNKIDIYDRVWIYNSSNDLNVVGSLINKNDKFIFKVITVMFHKDFRNKKETFKITI